MKGNRLSAREWGGRVVLSLLFTAIGSLIMIVFSPWRPLLGRVADYLGRIGLIVLLLVAVLLVRRSRRFEKYWQVLPILRMSICFLSFSSRLRWHGDTPCKKQTACGARYCSTQARIFPSSLAFSRISHRLFYARVPSIQPNFRTSLLHFMPRYLRAVWSPQSTQRFESAPSVKLPS